MVSLRRLALGWTYPPTSDGRAVRPFVATRGSLRSMSSLESIEDRLLEYRRIVASRDSLVLEAYAAGMTLEQIQGLSGVARSTIYRLRSSQRLAAIKASST